MEWSNHESSIELLPPKDFNWGECLAFLDRSDQEVLHKIKGVCLSKLIKVQEGFILFKISYTPYSITVEFPIPVQSISIREKVAAYIWEWFDLDQDLTDFYKLAGEDKVLQYPVQNYYGLRIICILDLFEALTWAIIGQQINLSYAYTLKKRFVENFGECISFQGETYWIFPSFEKIAGLNVDSLREFTHTGKKAESIIGIAQSMVQGELTKESMLQKQDCREFLLSYRGIGPWTADYVRMKCLHQLSAFPVADVGLHHALKNQLGLERKPTIEEIKALAVNWEGWQAYATFYLWRSLYE